MLDIKTICTGCNACVNICPAQCISIGPDREGFFYPHIDKTRCLGCHICEKHCPVFPESRKDCLSSSEALPTTYAAYNRNQAVRTSSSSGGLFFPLASSIIQQDVYKRQGHRHLDARPAGRRRRAGDHAKVTLSLMIP